MATRIKIDQAGLAPGVAGVSRTDGLETGALVTLENVGSEGVTEFRLLWGPPDDTTAENSLAPTDNPDVWTFTPTAGCYGTYRIELIENGVSLEKRVFGVRTPIKGLLIPALNERGSRAASWANDGTDQIELSENNAVDFPDPILNPLSYSGWWRAEHELYLAVEGGSGLPTIADERVLGNDSGVDGVPTAITVHQELDWLLDPEVVWFFDGINDYVETQPESSETFNFVIGQPMTISLWFLGTATGPLAQKWDLVGGWGSHGWQINPSTAFFGRIVTTFASYTIDVGFASALPLDGAWHQLVVTYDGTTANTSIIAYLDGVLRATTVSFNTLPGAPSSGLAFCDANLMVGGSKHTNDGASFLTGGLKHFSFWDKKLSAIEVTALRVGTAPADLNAVAFASNLKLWWKLDSTDPVSGFVVDHSVNSFVGVPRGGLLPSSTVTGTVAVRGSAIWEALEAGTVPGQALATNGFGQRPTYRPLSLAGLPSIPTDTFLAQIAGGTTTPTAVPLTTLAGSGLTGGTGAVLSVGSSTSITVTADAVQRSALAGVITAAANSNTTTFTAAVAKSVLVNAGNTSAVPAFSAAPAALRYLRSNAANTGLEWGALTSDVLPPGPQGPAGLDGRDGLDGVDGARGVMGFAGAAGATGATGPPPTGYSQTFAAAPSWTVNHNLGRIPAACSVHTLGGVVVDAEMQHTSVNQVIVYFDAQMAGAVELI
jgi:hypothetical protein